MHPVDSRGRPVQLRIHAVVAALCHPWVRGAMDHQPLTHKGSRSPGSRFRHHLWAPPDKTGVLPVARLNDSTPQKLQWRSPRLSLPTGTELDFGGIGKEYAVDRAYELLAKRQSAPFLVNLGGDQRANRAPTHRPWQVDTVRPHTDREATLIPVGEHDARATSGDSRRSLRKDGMRYGHILDPRTVWQVPGAPRSLTVAASSCTGAGLLATLALLQGAAEGISGRAGRPLLVTSMTHAMDTASVARRSSGHDSDTA